MTSDNSDQTGHASGRDEQGVDIASDVVATAALLLYSAVVAAGFVRVFSGWEFFDNLLVVAIGGHGVAFVLRRLRTPVWVAFPVTGLALIWLIGAMYYRDSYTLLVPTTQTWSDFRFELDIVGGQFRNAVAPVAFLAGWDVLASVGVAAAVLLADTFAFRAYARAESLVPGGVLFVFVAALGSDRSRVGSTMALVAAGVVATVVLRYHHAPDRAASIGTTRGFGARAIPVAVGSALSVALIAGFVGPRLPGAGAEPIYETKGGNGGSITEVISPLVDIRSRLTNRSRTELFVVRADEDSYWRSAALAKFDGQIWGIPSRGLSTTDDAIGEAAAGSVTIRQEIRVENLGGALLPAAADPIFANGVGEVDDDLRYNPDSATLVKTGDNLQEGDTFMVDSASPRFTAAELASATSNDPGDDIYLELPDDFPASIEATTREVVAGANGTYEIARTLQDWMRTEFTYDLEVQEGHGNNAIESFLENRVGYCEQFAGSYAAMLRSLGIPTRVAVGFTQGTSDGADSYSVLGRNAHAWPEVWFDGYGWVPFEPTPGRGAPNAQDYTGVGAQQDEGSVGGDDSADTGTGVDPTPTTAPATTIVREGGQPVGATPTTTLPGAAATAAPPTPSADSGVDIPWRLLAALLLVGLALAAPALVRRAKRAAMTTPQEQLVNLWTRATGAIAEMGLGETSGLTPIETAGATARVFPVASRPMLSLADVVTATTFAPEGSAYLGDVGMYGTTTLQSCASWCRQVERAVTDSLTPSARARRYFTVLE